MHDLRMKRLSRGVPDGKMRENVIEVDPRIRGTLHHYLSKASLNIVLQTKLRPQSQPLKSDTYTKYLQALLRFTLSRLFSIFKPGEAASRGEDVLHECEL